MNNRRFQMLAYSGGVANGAFGRAIFDVTGLDVGSGRHPILRQHDHNRIAGQSYRAVKLKGVTLHGDIFTNTEAGKEVVTLAEQGFQWQASVGLDVTAVEEVRAGQTVTVNGTAFAGPGVIVRASVLRESSFVPLGADAATSAYIEAAAVTNVPGLRSFAPEPKDDTTAPAPTAQELAKYRAAVAAGLVKTCAPGSPFHGTGTR